MVKINMSVELDRILDEVIRSIEVESYDSPKVREFGELIEEYGIPEAELIEEVECQRKPIDSPMLLT